MGNQKFSRKEKAVIRNCLYQAANGPYFDDFEFFALMGVTREEMNEIALTWPDVVDIDLSNLAVNNSLLLLTSYPHDLHNLLESETGVSIRYINSLFDKWRKYAWFCLIYNRIYLHWD